MGSDPRILVIRLSSLGDVVLTDPVYRNLKAHWPDCWISVLVKRQYAGVLRSHPCVDEVIRFRGILSAARQVRKKGFTHLLDLHRNWRSLWISALSGICIRAHYRKASLARRLFVYTGKKALILEKHTLERYLDSLSPWGVPIRFRSLEMNPQDQGKESKDRKEGKESALGKILVIQTAFLGDSTLTLPLLQRLRHMLPDSEVTVLSRPETADIFRASPASRVIEDDKRGSNRGIKGIWRTAKNLKGEGFALAMLPHRSFRSGLLAYLAGIPRRIGFRGTPGSIFLTERVPFTWLLHDVERNLSLLTPLAGAAARSASTRRPRRAAAGPLAESQEPMIFPAVPRSPAATTIDKRFKQFGLTNGRITVGIHPGSVWPTKRWLPERFVSLIRTLRSEPGTNIVLLGGPQDKDISEDICRKSGGNADSKDDPACLDWTGQTTIQELIEIIRRLRLFITNDSGPMHLSAALGVPTLGIFGPTTRELGFFPYGPQHRVIQAEVRCRPCSLHGARSCPEGHFLCMGLITANQVYEAALEMLKYQ